MNSDVERFLLFVMLMTGVVACIVGSFTLFNYGYNCGKVDIYEHKQSQVVRDVQAK